MNTSILASAFLALFKCTSPLLLFLPTKPQIPVLANCNNKKVNYKNNYQMSNAATKKASMLVATSIGAVEALKDQAGLCRWNYAMRSLYRNASNAAGSLSVKDQARAVVSSNSALGRERESGANGGGSLRGRRSEEKLNTAYHLICWGPK